MNNDFLINTTRYSQLETECYRNIHLMYECMKGWTPLSEYEIIFEASTNPDVERIKNTNDKISGKSSNYLKNAIDSVITVINNLLESIKDFFLRFTLNKNEREAFRALREQMAKDPSLRGKKITVRDFRKINADYDKLLMEVESEIRANSDRPTDQLKQKVEKYLGNVGKATTTIVSADVAIKMAESNAACARSMVSMLNTDLGIMEQLQSVIGDRESSKFKKRLYAAARNTKLHQLKLKILRRRYKSAIDCVTSTFTSLSHLGFINPFTSMGRRFLKNEHTGKAIKTTAKSAVKAGTRTRILKKRNPDAVQFLLGSKTKK